MEVLPPVSKSLAAPVVLLVDDQFDYRSRLARLLRIDHGLDVIDCGSGMAALTILINVHVDLVVADEQMPNMSGSTLLRTVGERWPATRRMLLTAFSHGELVARSPYRVLAKSLEGWFVTEIIDEMARET